MTTELEKEFFETFKLEMPMVKTVEYDNDPFAHCNDWHYGERTLKEAGLEKYTVIEINHFIKESKEKFPEEVKHNGVLTHNYRIVEAFNKYPQITDRHYLELICVLNKHTGIDVRGKEIEKLKEELLEHCIDLIEYELCCIDEIDEVKHQVQQLFISNQ